MQFLCTRKRLIPLIFGSIIGVSFCAFVVRDRHPELADLFKTETPLPNVNEACTTESNTNLAEPHSIVDPLGPLQWLNGPPMPSYKDNLQKDTKYITSWGSSAGWTNDVISFINLVYLGLITDRVPILPVFMSTHLPDHAPPLMFGDVFNVSRLRNQLGKPVLEWRDVKDSDSHVSDGIGCWNVWESVQHWDNGPRYSNVPGKLNLDVSYTKTPYWVKMIPNYEHDTHSTFWALAALAFPAGRSANLVTPLASPQHHLSLPPDEHLLCYDFLYYVAAQEPFEIGLDYSPAWRYVGQYMFWTEALQKITNQYVRRALRIDSHDPIPPFISIHARRDDFEGWCGDFPREECFASLDVIARRVEEVRSEIWQRKGIMVHRVIITSDEKDPEWWRQVAERGWGTPDHRDTEELYGIWYPVLIDAVILSQGIGFVGTDRSTMSILAGRRVEMWHDGTARMVKWGRPGADDH
ncbi:hypothetical protein B0H11DRAFT_1965830 [Mycena galericulata]|nr:hypothetical protein B0H11DRAFT_1965830 [Mycena galericulata]